MGLQVSRCVGSGLVWTFLVSQSQLAWIAALDPVSCQENTAESCPYQGRATARVSPPDNADIACELFLNIRSLSPHDWFTLPAGGVPSVHTDRDVVGGIPVGNVTTSEIGRIREAHPRPIAVDEQSAGYIAVRKRHSPRRANGVTRSADTRDIAELIEEVNRVPRRA